MKKPSLKKFLVYSLYIGLGVLVLVGGIVYSRYERDGLDGVKNLSNLLSQSIKQTTVPQPAIKEPITMTKEQIIARIDALEKEIREETNDPDRDIQLRTELFSMQTQLAELNKKS